MAKKLYATDSDVESIVSDLRKQLMSLKVFSDILIENKKDEKKCQLEFTPLAWSKMIELVRAFDTEVQWHGLVKRLSPQSFQIYDIILFPHEVTAATVISDAVKYSNWAASLDDETYDNMRFHGHSHVNMAVHPSATDTKYRQDIVSQWPKPGPGEDIFYVFLIINKRHEWSAEVFDATQNSLYSTAEITLTVNCEDESLDEFVKRAKTLAVAPRPVMVSTYRSPLLGGSRNEEPAKKHSSPAKQDYDEDYEDEQRYYRGGYYGLYDDYDPTDPFYARGD